MRSYVMKCLLCLRVRWGFESILRVCDQCCRTGTPSSSNWYTFFVYFDLWLAAPWFDEAHQHWNSLTSWIKSFIFLQIRNEHLKCQLKCSKIPYKSLRFANYMQKIDWLFCLFCCCNWRRVLRYVDWIRFDQNFKCFNEIIEKILRYNNRWQSSKPRNLWYFALSIKLKPNPIIIDVHNAAITRIKRNDIDIWMGLLDDLLCFSLCQTDTLLPWLARVLFVRHYFLIIFKQFN